MVGQARMVDWGGARAVYEPGEQVAMRGLADAGHKSEVVFLHLLKARFEGTIAEGKEDACGTA